MKQTEKTIIYDSPEAASIQTVTGWVSSTGRFWGKDEHMARYDGSTHTKCQCGCGKLMARNSWTECEDSRRKKAHEKYLKKPYKEWDGKEPVVIYDDDQYFMDADSFLEYCGDNDLEPTEVRLVICDANNLFEVDADYWSDIMPSDGDGDLPKEVEAALKALNEAIKKAPPISYGEGSFRTSYIDSTTIKG